VEVVAFHNALKTRFEKRDQIIDLVRQERYMQKEAEIPDAFKLTAIDVRLPIVNDHIDRLVGNLTANYPTIHIPPPAPGPQGLKRASKLEKCTTALLKKLEEDSGKNIVYKFFDSAVETGWGVLKLTYKPDRWNARPEQKDKEDPEDYLERDSSYKKGAKLPLSARVVDTRTFYPDPDEDGLRACIEVSKRSVAALSNQFPEFEDRARAAGLPMPTDMVTTGGSAQSFTLIEYWDREEAIFLILEGSSGSLSTSGRGDGLVLRSFKNPYPRVPYFIGFGQETSSSDPNFEALPSAYPIVYLAGLMNSGMRMWANVGYLTGFPTITKESPTALAEAALSENSDGDEGEEDLTPGRILQGPPGTKYGVLDYGRSATALTGMIGQIDQMIKGAGSNPIMQGIPPGSRTAGYAISELAAASKAKYQQIVRNAEKALSEFLSLSLWMIENLVDSDVPLLMYKKSDKGVTYQEYEDLSPGDIKGYYNVQVKIQPRNPVDRQAEGTFMANMMNNRLASRRQAIEEGLGVEQPDDVIDEILVEEALEDPQVKEFIKAKALQEAGLSGLMQDVKAAQALMQNQLMQAQQMAMGGAGGLPPGTNGNAGGMLNVGQLANPAPGAPRMEVPGMPSAPGMDQSATNPFSTVQQPRIYSQNSREQMRPRGQQAPVAGYRGR
jgi:hypothetical protein